LHSRQYLNFDENMPIYGDLKALKTFFSAPLIRFITLICTLNASPEKAGVGGSIPSLNTI
jgi:hypothetical protein